MLKRTWKYLTGGLVVVLVTTLVWLLLPPNVGIDSGGFLSMSAEIALAIGSSSPDEIAEQTHTIEREWIESVWMRTKNSKVFHSYEVPNRDYHDIYLDAVHYETGYEKEVETETGVETVYWTSWEDIDNTLEPAGELSPWDWQMVKADYNVYVLEDFTYGQILKFEKADPYETVLGDVTFQPMALQWTNDLNQIQEVSMPQTGLLTVADNRIEWDNAYGSGIDFSWTCYSTRLVKLLTIQSLEDLSTPEQYVIDGGNPVLELNLIFDPSNEVDIYIDGTVWTPRKPTTDTFGTVEFKLDATTLWGFTPLWIWDSSGENETTAIQRLRKVGNSLYVSVRVPYEWVQNATFPIYIDAVIDEWIETSSDDACEVVSDGSMNLTNTVIDLGSYTGGPTHAGLRFTGIDTTDVESVSTAYLEFYAAESDNGTVSYAWYGEDISSAVTFTTDAYDVSDRTRTTAGVVEDSPTGWVADTWVQTSDLSNILNEVFSRGDWISGNDLAILCIYNSGKGERRLRSWDYNDHSKAPKLHFENATEITYYYDEMGSALWDNDPGFMIDNILTNYAYTVSDGDTEHLEATTCPGDDLGTITKVELRVYGHGDGDDRIDLRYNPGMADEYPITMPSSPGWSNYVDVTADPPINGWTWAKVASPSYRLNVEYDKSGKGNTMYASKVEIRVTYWEPPVSDIDVGAAPIDRTASTVAGATYVDKNNPANASGSLHSVKVYAYSNITGLRVGTFYTTNGNTLKCRDSEAIGAVEAGAERTFASLSITVEAGDYIGCYFATGALEYDNTGFAGAWYVAGEYIDPNDESEYNFGAGFAISLYGYGDTGAAADITNAPTSKAFSIVAIGTDYWSDGSEPTWPLDDTECYFTVTNNGDPCSITVEATNFTGGVGWTLAGSPGENIATLKVGKSGDANEGVMITVTVSPQAFIAGLVTNIKWELKMETPTSVTDGDEKTSIITLAATLD